MIRNSIYNTVGVAISFLLSLVTVPLLIRLMGINNYGLWTLVIAVIGIFGLAEAGLSVSTTVFLSRDLAQGDATGVSQTLTVTTAAMLLIATGAGGLMWWGAPLGISLFPKLDDTQRLVTIQAVQVGGLVIWSRLLQQIMVGVLQAYRRYDLTTTVISIQTVVLNVGLLAITWLGGGIILMMWWQAVVGLAVLGLLVIIVWRLLSIFGLRPCFDRAKSQMLIRYTIMTWLVSLSSTLFSQLDRIIVGIMLGTDMLGVYGAITSVSSRINALSAAPVQPLLPELSNLLAKPKINYATIEQKVQQSLQFTSVVALGLGALLFTMAPTIVEVMLPGATNVSEYIFVFQLAVTIYTVYSLNSVGYYILLGNSVRQCTAVQLASAGVSLLLIMVGAEMFGLSGAIGGNVGYWGVWLLTFLGMKFLGISATDWIQWLKAPLIWFFVMLTTATLIPEWTILRLTTSLAGILILVGWWFYIQRIDLQIISSKLFSTRNST